MPKKREKNSEEYYRGIIRSQKSEIRNLKKRIKQLERREHFHEDNALEEEIEEIIAELPKSNICPECYKGQLVEYNVVGRHWLECNQCDYDTRKKLDKIKSIVKVTE